MPIYIPDSGTGAERLVVIGEAPAKHEEAQRRVLVGPTGLKLQDWMLAVGLPRSEAYMTNVLPFRAPADKIELADKEVVRSWTDQLHERLARLRAPVVLVPLGNTALRALTGQSGITKRRGSIYGYRDRRGRDLKVIPSIHPAALLHRGSKETDEALSTKQARTWERACRADWARIAADLQFPELRLPQRTYTVRPTLEVLRWFVQQCYAKGAILSLDIETPRSIKWVPQPPRTLKSGKLGKPRKAKKIVGSRRITCIGFSLDPKEGLTVPLTLSYWGTAERLAQAWACVKLILHSPAEKITHNGFFDYYYLADHGIRPVNWVWDTLALHHCLDPADDHGLAYCASIDTRQPFWKDMKDPKEGDDDEEGVELPDLDTFHTYCAIDSCATRELQGVYANRLGDRLPYYRDHYADLLEPLLELSRHGLDVDRDAMAAEAARLTTERAAVKAQLQALAGGENLYGPKALSSTKLAKFLYGTLRIPPQIDRKTKKPTTNEIAIRRLILNKATAGRMAAVGPLILADRRFQKLLEFTDPQRLDPDGRFRATYSFATDTGRLSSRANPKGTGANTQNIDRAVRRVFVPDRWEAASP